MSLYRTNTRIIARLDIKGPNLIKGVRLEGLRVVGEPNAFAEKYYKSGADELIYMDSVASLYGRNHLGALIEKASRNIFIPITVGGGIRSVEDARDILRSGADKVAINTAAVKNPNLINKLAESFGSQSIVSSIEAKRINENTWEVYVEGGREKTGIDVIDWVKFCESEGAGELLVTSIDNEGTRSGFEVDLYETISKNTSIPVIASGGFGRVEHALAAVEVGRVDSIAIADAFHYNRVSLGEVRQYCSDAKLNVRNFDK